MKLGKIIHALVIITLIAQSAVSKNSTPSAPLVSDFTVTSEGLGKFLGTFWKLVILFCLVLLIVDAVSRFGGSKLFGFGFAHSTRLIWWVYATAGITILGS